MKPTKEQIIKINAVIRDYAAAKGISLDIARKKIKHKFFDVDFDMGFIDALNKRFHGSYAAYLKTYAGVPEFRIRILRHSLNRLGKIYNNQLKSLFDPNLFKKGRQKCLVKISTKEKKL